MPEEFNRTAFREAKILPEPVGERKCFSTVQKYRTGLFTSFSLAIMSFTETISYTEARDRFADVLDTVEATRDAIVITRRGHANVVLIAQDELSSLQETAH